MKKQQLIRALRDAEYRKSLSAEERALLPSNPAGVVDLRDDDLSNLAGSHHTYHVSISCSNCESCWTGGSLCCC